jgi:hypothetical protein
VRLPVTRLKPVRGVGDDTDDIRKYVPDFVRQVPKW